MLQTTHYSLNLVEGTDVVNPLVQQNPNYSAIDDAMFANKQASIGTGTELTAGTVHTITRLNQDSDYVRFTATSNWTAGDSMVIDSTPVSVYLSDGTTPATGAYVINTEVLILVNGSRVTLLTSCKDTDTKTAAEISYDNTDTGMIATNVQAAIEEVGKDTGWLSTASVDGNTVQYRKIGHICCIRRGSVGTVAAGTDTIIGYLPAGFRPANNGTFSIVSGSLDAFITILDSDGKVTINSSNGYTPAYYITYFA